MSSRLLQRSCCLLVVLAAVGVSGCQNGNTVTKAEEEKFKNPPKEMPKEAIEFLSKHNGSGPPQGTQAPKN